VSGVHNLHHKDYTVKHVKEKRRNRVARRRREPRTRMRDWHRSEGCKRKKKK
jgi:hypothetical protein